MITPPIQITDVDADRLRRSLHAAIGEKRIDSADADKLLAELARAVTVDSHQISHEVVTMNSTVDLLDLETSEAETYTVVFPEEADISESKISVLAPLGTAVLGFKVGDVFEWQVPSGVRRLKIERIRYQPEAAGDFHL